MFGAGCPIHRRESLDFPQANISLANIYETLKTWKRLCCTCIVLALLEIHCLEQFYSHPIVAFSRLKVSMRISIQLGSAFITISWIQRTPYRVKWSTCMMRVTPITDNDIVLWKVCYNSQSQVINYHAEIERSCFTCNTKCGMIETNIVKGLLKFKIRILLQISFVDQVMCFNVIRSTRVNSCLSGSCFQHLVVFTRSYVFQWNTKRKTETAYNISLKTPAWQSKHKTITLSSDNFQVKCISFFWQSAYLQPTPSDITKTQTPKTQISDLGNSDPETSDTSNFF